MMTFSELERRDIIPIVDLCHFGVPDWIGNFQNPDFPRPFRRLCRSFRATFPWVQLYTPINEMFICAPFSAAYGWWNEQLSSDQAFVTALKHIVKANVLAMARDSQGPARRHLYPERVVGIFPRREPERDRAGRDHECRRFLSLDLNYGRRVDSEMYEFLMDNGMTRDEYHFFLPTPLRHHCIMGNDYYVTNEHRVSADGITTAVRDAGPE